MENIYINAAEHCAFIMFVTEIQLRGEQMPYRCRAKRVLSVTKVYIAIIDNASGKVYNDYMHFCALLLKEVNTMEKKTEVITIRITADTKRKLAALAAEKEWSIAQTANKIITNYLNDDLHDDTDQKTP